MKDPAASPIATDQLAAVLAHRAARVVALLPLELLLSRLVVRLAMGNI